MTHPCPPFAKRVETFCPSSSVDEAHPPLLRLFSLLPVSRKGLILTQLARGNRKKVRRQTLRECPGSWHEMPYLGHIQGNEGTPAGRANDQRGRGEGGGKQQRGGFGTGRRLSWRKPPGAEIASGPGRLDSSGTPEGG